MPNAFYYGDNLEVLRASTSLMRERGSGADGQARRSLKRSINIRPIV
jgi:hypothetical protein